MDSVRGQLLVAAPVLQDPNFLRTVILVAEHGDDGALGVVLNRPGDQCVADIVPDLDGVVDGEEHVFVGGPVQPSGVLVLAEFDDPDQAALPLEGDLGFVALESDIEALEGTTRRARAFAGHAGWGPGQLESELAEEAWFVAPFHPEDAFCEDPDELWARALARKGGAYTLVARMPLDPTLN
jgi:putative transcriptional regulator